VPYTIWVAGRWSVSEIQVNIAQLLKETVGGSRVIALDAPLPDSDNSGPGSVSGELRITKTDRGVWVSGSVEILVACECSRCLKPMVYVLPAKIDDEYLVKVDLATGARVRVDDRDADDADTRSIDDHHDLDLTETMQQYRVAGLWLAPICKDGCQGICAQCGLDLNENTHECADAIDPRWEKLRELLR
jgi:uncharacterized protein